jgi:hypothetical protein
MEVQEMLILWTSPPRKSHDIRSPEGTSKAVKVYQQAPMNVLQLVTPPTQPRRDVMFGFSLIFP